MRAPANPQFIEKRMALNAEGKPFDAKVYLNEMGEEKRWPDDPVPADGTSGNNFNSKADEPLFKYPLRSYFSYSSWKAWYNGESYESLEHDSGDAPAAAKVPA